MKHCLYTVMLLCAVMVCRAQWYNDGPKTNNGGLISDGSVQGINTATGSYTTAGSTGAPNMYGVFRHLGQSGTGANAAFTNNGSYDASINGQDYFLGPGAAAGQQEIAGSSMPLFGELFFQNGTGEPINITNTNGIRIATSISFENGITTTVRSNTATGAIKLNDGATYSNNNLGDAQHVNGYVSKTGNDAFTFPVGSGTDLRTLAITAPAGATDEYSVAWMAGDPSTNGDPSDGGAMHPVSAVTGPIVSVAMAGQWDWIAVSGTGAGITVTASIPDLSSTGVLVSDLRLVGWNGSSWIDLSGGPTASGNTEGSTLSGTMQPGISAIGIGSTSTALPVEWVYFKGEVKNCTVHLNWETASEANSSHFEVQRSTEGTNWANIGQLKAANNSTVSRQYNFVDEAPPKGLVLYRLRQVDIDGRSTISKIVHLQNQCDRKPIVAYPNPATDYVMVSGVPVESTVQLLNNNGQVVLVQRANTTNMRISLSGLSSGLYLVRILKGNTLVDEIRISRTPN